MFFGCINKHYKYIQNFNSIIAWMQLFCSVNSCIKDQSVILGVIAALNL